MADNPKRRGKADRRQLNRRQKHELDNRARRWRCSKLAVILADMLADEGPSSAESYIREGKATLRRANREARR